MSTTGNIWQDRENAIVNSIMSGNNSCGTIQKAMADGKFEEFLRGMVRPTLSVVFSENVDLIKQRDEANAKIESMRFALESAVANIPGIKDIPSVGDAFRVALPGHPFL